MSDKLQEIQSVIPEVSFQFNQDKEALFDVSTPSNKNNPINETQCCLLTTKGILKITGEKRLDFLQGQTTCDAKLITQETASYGAFCNLKGRVLANFLAFDDGQSSYLVIQQSLIHSLIEHLKKYAVFFRITLEQIENLYLAALINPTTASADANASERLTISQTEQAILSININTNRTLHIGTLEQLIQHLPKNAWVSESRWNACDIEQGITWVGESSTEQFLPQLIGLEESGGLSFTKGCYTGQEIIARMKYRGQLKRQMHRAELIPEDPASLKALSPGQKLGNQEKQNIGQIINAEIQEQNALALLTLENEITNNAQVTIDNNSFIIKLL